MRFNATPEDFLKGKIVNVGWHPVVVLACEDKESKGVDAQGNPKEKSTYAEVQFKIVDGPDKGVILYQNFSEKAPGFIVPMMEALGAKIDKAKGFQGEISNATLKGKTLDVHVVKGSWNNKPKNEIDGYRPFTGRTSAPGSNAGV